MARLFDGVAAWRVVALMGAIILATLSGIASGEAATREWSAFGQNETIIIADCRDCDEDTGMSVACQGSGQPAEVTVESVAVDNGREGAVLPIDIDIDGQVFTRQASTTFSGLVGYTPQFLLSLNDPMIEALQAGRSVSVRFSGRAVDISLRGSRRAFDIFKANCGW